MKKEIYISIVLAVLIVIAAGIGQMQAQQEAGKVYDVEPGAKGNRIILAISNTSVTTEAENVEITLVKTSKQLNFKEEKQIIGSINRNKGVEAEFTFDINLTAPANTEDTVQFFINGRGINLTKSFVLKYSAPKQYALFQNYPNPFNPSTTIRYSIPEKGKVPVNLKIYDILGKEVAVLINAEQSAGNYELEFNGSMYASGVYIYRLNAGSYSSIKKMMLLK